MSSSSGEGLNDTTMTEQQINQSKEKIKSTTNRRSKSLDDLLDDDALIIVEDNERETQSMENILESSPAHDITMEHQSHESIIACPSPVTSEKMMENEVITIDNSIVMHSGDEDQSQNDSGIHCDTPKHHSDNSSLDEDAISNTISMTSSTSAEKKFGKTFLNRYVKKVRNLMKK